MRRTFSLLLVGFVLSLFSVLPVDAQIRTFMWSPGKEVPADILPTLKADQCFKALPVDSFMKRIQGRSYKPNAQISTSDLVYLRLLHYNFEGKVIMGEMICNKAISADLIDIFHELYKQKYPIHRMVLIDEYNADDELSMRANNTSCFNYRAVAGTKLLSKHSRGMAVDVNPLFNPCVKVRGGKTIVQPSTATAYSNRLKSFPGKIDVNDACYKLFVSHGFRWGGYWRNTKDYQHFEK